MSDRALFTDREREVLRGEADDIKNPKNYRSKILGTADQRAERLVEDLRLLERVDPERAAEIRTMVCERQDERLESIEDRLRRVENEVLE